MNEKIAEFIARQTCGNLACVDETGLPWCFSFFYSWDAAAGLLHYKSSDDTRHSIILHANKKVAGTILPDKFNLLQIKGIQFEGDLLPEEDPQAAGGSAISGRSRGQDRRSQRRLQDQRCRHRADYFRPESNHASKWWEE